MHIRQTISAAEFIQHFPTFCSKPVKYGGFMIRAPSFIGLTSVIHLAKKPLSGQRE